MTDQNSLTFLNTTLQAKICEILLRLVMFSKSNVFMVIIIDGRAQLTARTYEVNKVFRFVDGIWLQGLFYFIHAQQFLSYYLI
mgnify:CR=1 FL=1